MGSQFSKRVLLTLAASSLILSSCGKKNVVNSSSSSSSFFTSGNSAISSTFVGYYNTVKSKVSCLSGRYRLNNDYTFYTSSGNFTNSTLYGTAWQAGSLTSGTVSEMYVGVSAYRDLMFVTKVVNSSGSVVGFNVTLSFCSIPNSYSTYPALVSNDRTIALSYSTGQSVNFTPYGITMASSTACGYGLVSAAYYTTVISQKINGNAYTADFPVYTTFSNSGCF